MIRAFLNHQRASARTTTASRILRRTFTPSTNHGAKVKLAPPSQQPPEKIITTARPKPSIIRVFETSHLKLALSGLSRAGPGVVLGIWYAYAGYLAISDPDNYGWSHLKLFYLLIPIVPALLYLTSGKVARILVRLPPHAQAGPAAMQRWVKNIPADTALEIHTVKPNGFTFHKAQCTLKELRQIEPNVVSTCNFIRLVDPLKDKRRVGSLWSRARAWLTEPPRKLNIPEHADQVKQNPLVKDKAIWPKMVEQIKWADGKDGPRQPATSPSR